MRRPYLNFLTTLFKSLAVQEYGAAKQQLN